MSRLLDLEGAASEGRRRHATAANEGRQDFSLGCRSDERETRARHAASRGAAALSARSATRSKPRRQLAADRPSVSGDAPTRASHHLAYGGPRRGYRPESSSTLADETARESASRRWGRRRGRFAASRGTPRHSRRARPSFLPELDDASHETCGPRRRARPPGRKKHGRRTRLIPPRQTRRPGADSRGGAPRSEPSVRSALGRPPAPRRSRSQSVARRASPPAPSDLLVGGDAASHLTKSSAVQAREVREPTSESAGAVDARAPSRRHESTAERAAIRCDATTAACGVLAAAAADAARRRGRRRRDSARPSVLQLTLRAVLHRRRVGHLTNTATFPFAHGAAAREFLSLRDRENSPTRRIDELEQRERTRLAARRRAPKRRGDVPATPGAAAARGGRRSREDAPSAAVRRLARPSHADAQREAPPPGRRVVERRRRRRQRRIPSPRALWPSRAPSASSTTRARTRRPEADDALEHRVRLHRSASPGRRRDVTLHELRRGSPRPRQRRALHLRDRATTRRVRARGKDDGGPLTGPRLRATPRAAQGRADFCPGRVRRQRASSARLPVRSSASAVARRFGGERAARRPRRGTRDACRPKHVDRAVQA